MKVDVKLSRGAMERTGSSGKAGKGKGYEGSMFKVIYLSDSALNESKYIYNKNTPMKMCVIMYVCEC